jgi:hypothetical protein
MSAIFDDGNFSTGGGSTEDPFENEAGLLEFAEV